MADRADDSVHSTTRRDADRRRFGQIRSRRAPFRQADLRRALRATKAEGMQVSRIEIDPTGKLVIMIGAAEPEQQSASVLDTWLANHARSS